MEKYKDSRFRPSNPLVSDLSSLQSKYDIPDSNNLNSFKEADIKNNREQFNKQ